jgi:hypothetical protein
MNGTYSLEQTDRYCASVGFFDTTQELVSAISLEIKDCVLAKGKPTWSSIMYARRERSITVNITSRSGSTCSESTDRKIAEHWDAY